MCNAEYFKVQPPVNIFDRKKTPTTFENERRKIDAQVVRTLSSGVSFIRVSESTLEGQTAKYT